jgi:hypothetical protein
VTTPEPAYYRYYREAARSAVHLEMRDMYEPSNPVYQDWRSWTNDNPGRPFRDWYDAEPFREWSSIVEETVGRGVRMRRARIVSEPVTDYIRFEHHVTGMNLDAGEEVRWLPRRQASDIALPGNDFWLFDEEWAHWNHFAGDGASMGEEITDDPAAAKLCADGFEAVWARAVPHDQYVIH